MDHAVVSRLEYARSMIASIARLIAEDASKELVDAISDAARFAERDECKARGEPHLKLVDH